MNWRWVVRICYLMPPVFAVAMVAMADMLSRTHHVGRFPVRMDGLEFIVWRYDRRWIDVDFKSIVQYLLMLDFWALVIGLIVFLIIRAAMRRDQQRRGFEVLLPRPEHTERP